LVVQGTVQRVTARFEKTPLGDELIISRLTVAIASTLRGPRGLSTLDIDVVGGTLNEGTPQQVTLKTSSLPELPKVGDRAVYLLKAKGGGVYELTEAALGYLPLDADGRLREWNIPVSEV